MDEIEQALHMAFRRESPPAGFAQRVEFALALQTSPGSASAWQPDALGSAAINRGERGLIHASILGLLQKLFPARTVPATDTPPLFQGLRRSDRSPFSTVFSIALHVAAIAIVTLFVLQARLHVKMIAPGPATAIDVRPWLPVMPDRRMLGGGGGGDHDLIEAAKGRLPKLDRQPITPPQILRNDHPKLAIEPTIVMPKHIPLPNAEMPNLGAPTSAQVRVASSGNGAGSGIGSGSDGGIGNGQGRGYGPGSGGGTGGGLYHVGGGVSAPIPIFEPDPEYTDEARRAKYTGIVVVSLIVDTHGLAERVRVVRALGMGLDQKAVEAVRLYKFKPAQYQGKPVPVEVNIEVNFQIY